MNKVDKVVILGGGSAGWMTAATLIHNFPEKEIVLVESPDTPRIGVGESTLAGLPAWLKSINVDYKDFMKHTDASFKLSIKFTDFHRVGDGGFHYPFGNPFLGNTTLPNANDWHMLKHFVPETTTQSYVNALFPQSVLLDTNKIMNPKKRELEDFTLERDFALHFDAMKFADWLAENYSKPRGVKQIVGHVENVVTNDDGIEKLVLKSGEEITADLFIDCTGFKSMLLGQAMEEEFLSFADKLPVNRTWAVQIPYVDAENEIQNFTESTALGYGWVWNAPLYSRIGTGYVYSDRFTTPEDALEEFKVYLRKRFGEERINDSLKFNEIKFKSGTYRRTWVKNVVGIGLSATFLEPLESNGLFFIHESANTLVKFLRRGYVNGLDVDFYNATVRNHFEFFASFLEYHYVLSERRDTSFWKYMTERPVEKYLAEKPAGSVYTDEQNFKTTQQSFPVVLTSGFHCIAVGHEYYPVDPISISYWQYHYDTDYKKVAGDFYIKTEKSQKNWLKAVENAPTHYQYLKENFHKEEM